TVVLANGFPPTGTITFTLVAPGGATVDRETVTVTGDGPYSTPTGFTLPGSGTVAGTYQWDVTYSGDANNSTAADINNASEQTTVFAAETPLPPTPPPPIFASDLLRAFPDAAIATTTETTLLLAPLPLPSVPLLIRGLLPPVGLPDGDGGGDQHPA